MRNYPKVYKEELTLLTMEISAECLICKQEINKPKIGQITCGAKACKRKYKSIWKEAKLEGIDMPEEI